MKRYKVVGTRLAFTVEANSCLQINIAYELWKRGYEGCEVQEIEIC